MDIAPLSTASPCYPTTDSAQKDDFTAVNIPKQESVATKPLWNRSVMRSKQVTAGQLTGLLIYGGRGLADDNVIYEVNGSVWIIDCDDLRFISGNISVAGELFIRNCPNLRELSAHLFVGHDMSIYDCPGLETVSGSICVRGSLFVNALGLVDVPGNLHVGDWADLSYCRCLKDISGTFYSGSDLELCHCKSLENLTGNITVCGDIDLDSCHLLTNLSGTLSVGGNINRPTAPPSELPD